MGFMLIILLLVKQKIYIGIKARLKIPDPMLARHETVCG